MLDSLALIFFIILSEACERYSFYAMKSVLFLYITEQLGFEDQTGLTIVRYSTE